ncbi:MAG: mandelate racemase/muconate lactonizing enzyme family protein [Ignavibacteriales bacterium]
MARPLASSLTVTSERRGLLVRLVCESGVEGWGEAWNNFPSWGSRDRALFISRDLAPEIIGCNPLDRDALIRRVFNRFTGIGHVWGAIGVVYEAISAIDIALWDIVAQAHEKPLWRMLGGEWPGRIAPYASGIDQQGLGDRLEELVGRGFSAFKVRVGFDPDRDLEAVRLARRVVGDDAALMVDANQGWSRDTAAYACSRFADLGLRWVEEPLVADDFEGLAFLRERTGVTVAAGEDVYGRPSFEQLAARIPIVQPDVAKHGGITALCDLLEVARSKGSRLIPHYFGSAIGLAATLHFIAGLCEEPLLEMDASGNPLVYDLVPGFPAMEDGVVRVPDGPGLGVRPDSEALGRFAD